MRDTSTWDRMFGTHAFSGRLFYSPTGVKTIMPKIEKIIYNESKGATTVIFENKDVVVVRKTKDVEHNLYNAVSAAIVKYVYGSNTQFKKQLENVEIIKPKKPKKEKTVDEPKHNFKVGDIVWYDDKIRKDFYKVEIKDIYKSYYGYMVAKATRKYDGVGMRIKVVNLHKEPNLEKYKEPF